MAATHETTRLIDLDLHVLEADLADLPILDEEWETLDDAARASLSHDWDQQMSILKGGLDPAYRGGAMTPAQCDRYRAILAALRQARPVLRGLKLYEPPVSLEP
jgi:hypothetical protein